MAHHRGSAGVAAGVLAVGLLALGALPGSLTSALPGAGGGRAAGSGPLTVPSPAADPTGRPAARPAADRPNVVVVMADDMRVDDLDFAPYLRRLVERRGLRFENSFSPYPLCCPARASFLTGRYAHNHGVYWHESPYGFGAFDDSRTIATSLRRAGYRTGFIGKYLNGYGVQPSRVTGGPSLRYVPPGWDDWRGAVETFPGSGVHGSTYDYLDTPFNVNGRIDNGHRGEYQTHVLGDFAVDMARGFSRSRDPFFMYLSFVAPHHGAPREPDDPGAVPDDNGVVRPLPTPARPAWVRGRFDAQVKRASGLPRGGGPAEARIRDKGPFFALFPEVNRAERRALREVTRQRAESVFVMDRQVRRLVRELRRRGEWQDTVLMFTSDNGYFLGEHRQRVGKVRAHEPSLRVPLLVTGPGMREEGGQRFDPISTVDLPATILDLAGARPPVAPDGQSRLATMLDGDRGWTVPVVTEATHTAGLRASFGPGDPRTSVGLRTPRWSFTRYNNGAGELYDLRRDPLQMRDVYGRKPYAAIVRLLNRELRRYRDCRGQACRAPMAAELRATPEELRAMTTAFWRRTDKVYGRH